MKKVLIKDIVRFWQLELLDHFAQIKRALYKFPYSVPLPTYRMTSDGRELSVKTLRLSHRWRTTCNVEWFPLRASSRWLTCSQDRNLAKPIVPRQHCNPRDCTLELFHFAEYSPRSFPDTGRWWSVGWLHFLPRSSGIALDWDSFVCTLFLHRSNFAAWLRFALPRRRNVSNCRKRIQALHRQFCTNWKAVCNRIRRSSWKIRISLVAGW